MSAMGGGVGFGDGTEPASTPLGLLLGVLAVVLGGGFGYLALGVHRGRLIASMISICLAAGTTTLGVVQLLLGRPPASIREGIQGLGVPLVLLALLVSPSHRRYVSLRRASVAAHPAG
jgi:hypothetical protein